MFHHLKKDSPWIIPCLLILLVACWIEVDLFAPSLSQIRHAFDVTPEVVQWTLSINFFGFFISSLFFGPLADSIGRRRVLLIGAALFAFGGFIVWSATSIEIFLFGRLLQGLGVSAPAVLCLAVLFDIYSGDRLMKLLSLTNSVITIVMAAAPIVGTYVTQEFGWRANFAIIAMGALLGGVIIAVFLPETLDPVHRREFRAVQLVQNYIRLMSCRSFILPILGMCAIVTPYFVFIGIIPLLFVEKMQIPLNQYVYFQGAAVGVFAFLSLLVPKIMERYNVNKLTYYSVWLLTISAIALGIIGYFVADNPVIITTVMCFLVAGMVLPVNILYIKATNLFPDLRASAAALTQSLRMFMMSIGTAIAGKFYDGTYAPTGLLTAIFVVAAVVMIYPFVKPQHQTPILESTKTMPTVH